MKKVLWGLVKLIACSIFAIPLFKLADIVDSSNALGEGFREFFLFLRMDMYRNGSFFGYFR